MVTLENTLAYYIMMLISGYNIKMFHSKYKFNSCIIKILVAIKNFNVVASNLQHDVASLCVFHYHQLLL